jgi:MFS family permease
MTTSALVLRPAILSPALVLRFVSIVGSAVSFYLPLAVLPLFADAAGAHASAGLATGALLIATVACELVTPRLVALAGYRWALGIGLFLLGAPALVLLAWSSPLALVAISVVRGAGFAISVVAGGALTAALIPNGRRGEGLAIVGLVSGVPGVLALPLGVWAAGRFGFGSVFVVTALFPLVALVTLPGLPAGSGCSSAHGGLRRGLRNAGLMRPALIFAAATTAAGVLVTYLPLAIGGALSWVVPVALFLQPAASTAARLAVGRLGDRRGQGRLLGPGVVLSIAGMAALAATHSPVTVLAGATTFGIGLGILQNATITLMYARVDRSEYSTVAAIWNAAFDLGMAVGAMGIGVLVAAVGYSPAFLATAAVMLPALLLVRREMVVSAP